MSLLPANFPMPDNLTQGTDFKCVDAAGNALPICFGIGAGNHALLQLLQQGLNQLAGRGGFAPLVIDGFVGDDTVAAVQALFPIGGVFWTKELVAQRAPLLLRQADSTADALAAQGEALAPTGEPVVPTQQTVAATGVPIDLTHEIVAATLKPTPGATKSKILPLVLVGVTSVLAVGVGGFFYYRRKLTLQPALHDYDAADELGDDEED